MTRANAGQSDCKPFNLIAFITMIVLGGVYFSIPEIGPPALVEVKEVFWRTPWVIALVACVFFIQFAYLVWCFGFMPGKFHPAQATASTCKVVTSYIAFSALAGCVSGMLALGSAWTQMDRFAILGVAFMISSVSVSGIIGYVLYGIRRAMDATTSERPPQR